MTLAAMFLVAFCADDGTATCVFRDSWAVALLSRLRPRAA